MSYGPQLPPHLQKQRPPSHQDSDSDNEDQIGPKLPGEIDKKWKSYIVVIRMAHRINNILAPDAK
jgi:hypothetical protein